MYELYTFLFRHLLQSCGSFHRFYCNDKKHDSSFSFKLLILIIYFEHEISDNLYQQKTRYSSSLYRDKK